MFTGIKTQLSRREKLAAESKATDAILKNSAPLLRDAVKLAEKAGVCAEKSYDRLEDFSTKYPFYQYNREAPAFVVLAQLLDFLSLYAYDQVSKYGVILADWSEGGPLRLKRLAKLAGTVAGNGDRDYDAEEYHEADQAYRALFPELAEDCKPLFGPLEKYLETCKTAFEENRALLTQQHSAGISTTTRGYSLSALSLVNCIMSILTRYPEMPGALKAAGRDYGFWLRQGEPKPAAPTAKQLRRRLSLQQRIEQLESFLIIDQ